MSVTPLHDVSHTLARVLMAIVLISTLSMTTASCGGDGGAKVPARVVEIVVPAGTQAKLDRGELVDVMPAELYFKVGDVFRVRNNDSAAQFVGPYRVEAGEKFELTFGAPGEYGGLCSLSGGASYKFVITE